MSGEAILIVDDNPTNLKLVRILLERQGYDIRTAQDAKEALQILLSFKPRIILMDIQLPGMDGLELTRQLKADPQYKNTVFIAITAYAMKGDEEKAIAAGCNGYIAKPIDTRTLPTLIASYLNKKKTNALAEDRVRKASAKGEHQTIFLIEDNLTTRKYLKALLEQEHYIVIDAYDGQNALKKIKNVQPDLILMDLVLPDMDGIELCRNFRTILGFNDKPIIALTGFLTKFDNPILLDQSHFTGYMFKPVEKTLLLQLIRSYLPGLHSLIPNKSKHIFLVDDNLMQLKALQIQLKHTGFIVSTTSNSKTALEQIKTEKPDLVISDVLMPHVDGFELCLQIRNDAQLHSIPVVLMSSHYLENADYELGKQVGATVFINRKPNSEELMKVIEDIFNGTIPANTIQKSELFKDSHSGRLIRQLERQVEANTGLAELCALQSAQLSLLGGIAEALTTSVGIDNAISDVLNMCLDAAGISKSVLFLVDQNKGIILKHVLGYNSKHEKALVDFFWQHQLIDLIISTKKIIHMPSEAVDKEISDGLLKVSGLPSALLIPLISDSKCLGVLFLGSELTDITVGEPLNFARILAVHIGQTIALASAFERLFISEHKHRILMDNASCGILVLNLEGKILEVNKTVELIMNSTKNDIIGEEFRVFIFQSDREFAEKQYISLLHEGIIGPNELKIQPKSGAPRVVEYSGAIVKTLKEDFILMIINDVTERNQIRIQALLNDKLAAIGTLAAGMAHEINNPIAWVLGNLSFIKESVHKLQTNVMLLTNVQQEMGLELNNKKINALLADLKTETIVKEIDEIIDESIQGIDRVRDIVDSLRGGARMSDDQLSPIKIDETIDSVIRIASSEVKCRATIVKKITPNLPKITINHVKLHQVLLNLILNAVQSFSEDDVDKNTIRIQIAPIDNGIKIDISDNGVGISAENLLRIFDPFFTTKPIGTGTGLGLTICHDIIKECGGEIKVESTLGKGSTFSVLLPLIYHSH